MYNIVDIHCYNVIYLCVYIMYEIFVHCIAGYLVEVYIGDFILIPPK